MGKKLVRCSGCGRDSYDTYCIKCQKAMDFNRALYNKEQELIAVANIRKESRKLDGGIPSFRVG